MPSGKVITARVMEEELYNEIIDNARMKGISVSKEIVTCIQGVYLKNKKWTHEFELELLVSKEDKQKRNDCVKKYQELGLPEFLAKQVWNKVMYTPKE